jgi:cytochrome b561
VTPRGTDWGLAALVGLLFVTGVLSLFAGAGGDAWVFVAHDVAGAILVVLVAWKLRRVWKRLVRVGEWDRATLAAVLATLLVVTALASGWIWSSGGNVFIASYNLLDWHYALGIGLTLVVLVHAALRAKAPRTRPRPCTGPSARSRGCSAGAAAAGGSRAPTRRGRSPGTRSRPHRGWPTIRGGSTARTTGWP